LLGLTGSYSRFIKSYAQICRPLPLIELLKKDGFAWTSTASKAFQTLKVAMTTTPVMALPNFDMKFDVETDASTTGVGGALQQNRHLIAFISKELGSRWANLSVYEKELLAVFAVQKWGVIPVGQGFHY